MTQNIDIGRKAMERLAAALSHDQAFQEDVSFALVVADNPPPEIAALILALRDALDAAEARNDSWAHEYAASEMRCVGASAEGYARGVRDAAKWHQAQAADIKSYASVGGCSSVLEREFQNHLAAATAILALLPADVRETPDD